MNGASTKKPFHSADDLWGWGLREEMIASATKRRRFWEKSYKKAFAGKGREEAPALNLSGDSQSRY